MAFLGMRGSGDWADHEVDDDWRMRMLQLFPNGDLTLTGILSMMGKESTNRPHFHWFAKTWPTRRSNFDRSSLKKDGTDITTTTGTFVKGDILTLTCPLAYRQELRPGHVVRFGNSENETQMFAGAFVDGRQNPADSSEAIITVRALEAAAAGTLNWAASGTYFIWIIGSASAEGADRPLSTSYDPNEYNNYTQIFRESLDLTRTAVQTVLRDRDAYMEKKMEALQMYGRNMEQALLFGVKDKHSDTPSGKEIRFTQGIIPFLKENKSSQVIRYPGSQSQWIASIGSSNSGEDFLDNHLTDLFVYGMTEKMAICGNKAMQALGRTVKAQREFNFTARTDTYGIRIREWETSQGTIYAMTHPLFSTNPALQKSMLILEPRHIKERVIQDTIYIEDDRLKRTDNIDEEWKSELGYEFHHPETFLYLTNIGG